MRLDYQILLKLLPPLNLLDGSVPGDNAFYGK